jgi:molecular chaperone DnaK (HSP70)
VSEPQHGIFGIDLGTTYSVVGYIDETGRAAVTRNNYGDDTTPSVVYFENENNVVVGKVAKESAGLYPDQVVSLIKREMGDREYRRTFFGTEYTPPSISALILGALAQDAEKDTGRKVTDVVITVPAYFGLLEKEATRQAGEIAGLNVIGIVPEPVAAAMQYGVTGNADGTTFLVFDLGGGTFDISLIRMTDDSVEVLAVGGDHKLGGADWDEKLFDYIVDQAIEQSGDDSLRDDEAMLQDLRTLAEKTKKDLSATETKKLIVRSTGTAAKITVTRAQFEQMTAELLDETIRITRRTLAEAQEKYPGIQQQIGEVLLVGGSCWMPAVADALKREFGWDPKLADPDLAVAKGAALYAAGQTVRFIDKDSDGGGQAAGDNGSGDGGSASLTAPAPVTEEAVRTVAGQTGIAEEDVRRLAQRTVVNVLPKAIGVKLVDTDALGWENDVESAYYIEHLVDAQTQLPFHREPFVASTVVANQPAIEIEIWEQAGASPGREMSANQPLDSSGQITGLAPHALPAGSPVNLEISVDNEGTVHLKAVEPTSSQKLELSVRISILSAEQVADAKRAHAGLTVST